MGIFCALFSLVLVKNFTYLTFLSNKIIESPSLIERKIMHKTLGKSKKEVNNVRKKTIQQENKRFIIYLLCCY